MVNPVPGHEVGTPFGKRGPLWSCDEINGEGKHTGVDFPAPTGTKVVAARAGVTAHVNFGGAFGTRQLVVRCDDGTEDFYAHMSARVGAGKAVQAGDKVGEVGESGNTSGPHLHFERHSPQGPPWSCGIIVNPSSSLREGAAALPGQRAQIRLSKLRFGVMDAGAVRRLQRALNRHRDADDPVLPVSGNYLDLTDVAVRMCQLRHSLGQDPAGASFVGSTQARHLFGPRVRIIDDLEAPVEAEQAPADA